MAKQVVRRQGTAQEHQIFTGAEGEWTHDNTLNTARFHDGVTAAGYPALLSNNVNEISTNTELTGSNFGELVVVDSTTGNVTITLPDPSLLNFGWQVAIKKAVDANSVTVDTDGASTIDGDASVLLENAENAVQVRSDGSNWYALRLNNFDDAQEILYDNSDSSLGATTVKNALDELDSEKINSSDLTGGTGVTYSSGNISIGQDVGTNASVTFLDAEFTGTGAVELPEGTEAQRPGTAAAGMIRFNSDASSFEGYDGSAWGEIGGGGKVLQVVRATDATEQTSSNDFFSDAGISVTIAPKTNGSKIILLWSVSVAISRSGSSENTNGYLQITDNDNNVISGAENLFVAVLAFGSTSIQWSGSQTIIGYDFPSTTSSITYKARFAADSSGRQITLLNSDNTGQLYAIEVAT